MTSTVRACICSNTYLSVVRVGALSCNRVIQATALALSYRPHHQAAGPACTAAAAVHAGWQGVPLGAWARLTSPQASGAKSIGETHLNRQKEKDTHVGLNKGLFHIWFDPCAENRIQHLCIATLTAQHSPQEMKGCKYKSLPKGSRGVRCEEDRVWQICGEKCAFFSSFFLLRNSRVLVCTERETSISHTSWHHCGQSNIACIITQRAVFACPLICDIKRPLCRSSLQSTSVCI